VNGGFFTKDGTVVVDWDTAAPNVKRGISGLGAIGGGAFFFFGCWGGCTNGGMISPLLPGKNVEGSDGVSEAGPARFGMGRFYNLFVFFSYN
jgi:hypothetical protein